MTKKRLAILTAITAIVYSLLLYKFLPVYVVEQRMEYSTLFFGAKILFVGIVFSIGTSLLLAMIIRRRYVKDQLTVFRNFKYYLQLLVRRDFITRYRKSMLGVLWSLLNPLLTMLVMTMVFSYIFSHQIENFPVYLFCGQIILSFYSESTRLAMGSMVNSASIIRKIYIPKYIFPLSRIISSLVNVIFSLMAFLVVFIITGAQFRWTMLLIPVPLIYTFVFALGVGFFLSALNVFFRDLDYLYGVFITLLTYLTPIFYPVSRLPVWVQQVIGVNPIYHFVDYFRSLTLYGVIPDLWSNIVCVSFAMISLCIGMYMFMSLQHKFVLYL